MKKRILSLLLVFVMAFSLLPAGALASDELEEVIEMAPEEVIEMAPVEIIEMAPEEVIEMAPEEVIEETPEEVIIEEFEEDITLFLAAEENTISIKAAKNTPAEANAVIAVGETLTILVSHGSDEARNFAVTVADTTVAAITEGASINVAKEAEATVEVEGLQEGKTDIILTGTAADPLSTGAEYFAVIHLTVSAASADPMSESGTVPVTLVHSPGDGRYIGFTSDMHGEAGNLENWFKNVTKQAALTNMCFCGDFGNSSNYGSAYFNSYKKAVDLTEQYVGQNTGIYTTGNHEWMNYISQGGSLSDFETNKGVFHRLGRAENTPNTYGVYCIGAYQSDGTGGFQQADIDTLDSFLSGCSPTTPVFILSHYPLHYINSRKINNADKVIDMLNKHPNAVFVWGHNHSQGAENHYGEVKSYGENIQYASSQNKIINFIYACAGSMKNDRGAIDGLVVTVEGTALTFTYYDAGGPASERGTVYLKTSTDPAVTYTVTYNANGGSGAPSAQTKTAGVALTLSSMQPTRTGYTFQGWATSSTGSPTYQPGGIYTADADVTLYAVWKNAETPVTPTGKQYLIISNGYALSTANTDSYTTSGGTYSGFKGVRYTKGSTTVTADMLFDVTMNGNSYTISQNEKNLSGTYTSGTGGALTLGSQAATWTNNSGKLSMGSGYLTHSDGTSGVSGNPNVFSMRSSGNAGTITFEEYTGTTPQPATTYTVSFNANGGSGAPSAQTKTAGVALTLSSMQPTRTGYTFQGWATSSTGSAAYQPGGIYTADADVTLYAVWKGNTYTVTYNANGGSGAPSAQTKTAGAALTLSSMQPTRTGYTFQGWATSSTGSPTYQPGGRYTADADVTLYAVWKGNTYTVTYNANGGSGAPSAQTKTAGAALTLSSMQPTRTGYTFQGWATSSTGSAAYQPGGRYTADADVTLYAVWKGNTYTVTYNANGGSGAPSAQTKTAGAALTLSSMQPTRTGYTFQGWATSSTGSATYQPGGRYTADADVTLYAVWKGNTYTVTYNANGGSGAPSAQTKTAGAALTLSSMQPTRTGYTFQGWATSSTGSAAYQPGGRYTADADVTLYAVWKENTYTVTYNANGSGAPSAQTKTAGAALTLSSMQPTRTGYTFQGWATSSTGSPTYQPGGRYTADADVTLYAVWKQESTSDTAKIAFIERLYSVCLGRDAKDFEVDYYVGQIRENGMTGAEAAYEFIFADEFKIKNYCDRHYTEALYKAFMGRTPAENEIDYYVYLLQQGSTREDVFNLFIKSAEFGRICAKADITVGNEIQYSGKGTRQGGYCTVDGCTSKNKIVEFATRLYTVCLDRAPEQTEIDAWHYNFVHGDYTATSASEFFLFSEEFIGKKYSDEDFVKHLYDAMMGRNGSYTADELAYWCWMLGSNGMTREEAFKEFAASDEFKVICQQYGVTC